MTLLVFLISSVLFAGTLWLSIRLVDGYNSANTLGAAAMIGCVMTFSAMFGGASFALLPLIALLYMLVKFYDISLIRSFVTVFVLGAMNFGIDRALQALAR